MNVQPDEPMGSVEMAVHSNDQIAIVMAPCDIADMNSFGRSHQPPEQASFIFQQFAQARSG